MFVNELAVLTFIYLLSFVYIYLFSYFGNGKVLRSLYTFPEGFAINVFSQMLYNLTYLTKSDRKLQCIKIVKRLVKHIVDSFICIIFASSSLDITICWLLNPFIDFSLQACKKPCPPRGSQDCLTL